MPFRITFTNSAAAQFERVEKLNPARARKVRRCLARLEINPKHPGLNSHKFVGIQSESGEDVWESYVENNTPSAWRVFWFYGPGTGEITVIEIVEHP